MEQFLNEWREEFVRKRLMSDEFLEFMSENLAPFEDMYSNYRCAIMEIETKFRVLNEELSMRYDRNPIEEIKSRTKSLPSLFRKIRIRNVPLNVEAIEEQITDIAGVRVICSFPKDIYDIEESFLRQDDIKLLKRKDYIQNPKDNGYRSLHLIVEVPIFLKEETKYMKVEVQFRTIAMDFWASLEHKLAYKKNIPEEYRDALDRELKDCAEQSAALDLRMQALREHIESIAKHAEITKQGSYPPAGIMAGAWRKSADDSGEAENDI